MPRMEFRPLREVQGTTLDYGAGVVYLHLTCGHTVKRQYDDERCSRRARCHECAPDALTPAVQRLVDDAERRGMKPRFNGGNGLLIGWKRGPRVQVYLSPEGGFYSAHRADTDLSVCTAIRTIKAVRKALAL